MKRDRIRIEDLEVFANHGVYAEENILGQKFLVTVDLFMNTRPAGQTDDLEQSVNYGEVSVFVDTWLREHTYKLLECAAEKLAEELLLKYNKAESLQLQIKKPWAPVGLPLRTVSLSIERGWHTAYIALGSNMGNRKEYLDTAVRKLGEIRTCEVKKVSSFIETPPYGVTEQADFLNGCLELRTTLDPEELLEELHRIENEAGRERIFRWGPRTLDLDLIFYDDIILQEDGLCIPHVEVQKRKFVLEPLCEIAPYKRHPVYGKTVYEMLENLMRKGETQLR